MDTCLFIREHTDRHERDYIRQKRQKLYKTKGEKLCMYNTCWDWQDWLSEYRWEGWYYERGWSIHTGEWSITYEISNEWGVSSKGSGRFIRYLEILDGGLGDT